MPPTHHPGGRGEFYLCAIAEKNFDFGGQSEPGDSPFTRELCAEAGLRIHCFPLIHHFMIDFYFYLLFLFL